eukprot:3474893-Rhodomonas_salina.1
MLSYYAQTGPIELSFPFLAIRNHHEMAPGCTGAGMHQMDPSQLQCKVLRQELLRTTGLPLSFLSPLKVCAPLLLFSTYFSDSDVPLSSSVGNLQGGFADAQISRFRLEVTETRSVIKISKIFSAQYPGTRGTRGTR